MMTDLPNLSELLDAERKRLKHKPEETAEQRIRKLRLAQFHKDLDNAWIYADLADDGELIWLSTITEAAKAKGTRKYRRWSGGTAQVVRATTYDDAVRLHDLKSQLWDRHWKRDSQRRRDDRRKIAEALRRLELPVPDYLDDADGGAA